MAGLKETPRQKMINILYLVLLAMLALNVSDSVLNAFKTIRDSMVESKNATVEHIDRRFNALDFAVKNQPKRAKPLQEKAEAVRVILDELNDYVADLKVKMVNPETDIDPVTGNLSKRSNLDIIPRIMINQGEATKLKVKINETKEKLLPYIDEKDRNKVQIFLSANDLPSNQVQPGKSGKWENLNFDDGTPLTAGYTILEKIQLDIKNTLLNFMSYYVAKLTDVKLTVDSFDAVAVSPSNYVLLGDRFTSEVFLTAYDSKTTPEITVNGRRVNIRNGKGLYSVRPTKEGVYKWRGSIKVKQNDGKIKEYLTPEQSYRVARPSAVVSPDKMNVLYIGVDNPLSISASGFSKEDLSVSITKGKLKQKGGKYLANVIGRGEVNVTVASKADNQSLGTFLFRVKEIPDPIAKFAGKPSGKLGAGVVKSQDKIFAVHENIDFDVVSTIQQFTIYIERPRSPIQVYTAKSNRFTNEMKNALKSVVAGSRIIFDNIIALKPGKLRAQLNPIIINVI